MSNAAGSRLTDIDLLHDVLLHQKEETMRYIREDEHETDIMWTAIMAFAVGAFVGGVLIAGLFMLSGTITI